VDIEAVACVHNLQYRFMYYYLIKVIIAAVLQVWPIGQGYHLSS